jgi:hypothetical protein
VPLAKASGVHQPGSHNLDWLVYRNMFPKAFLVSIVGAENDWVIRVDTNNPARAQELWHPGWYLEDVLVQQFDLLFL